MIKPRPGAWSVWLAVFLIVAGVSLRVARHFGWIVLPPNFAPVSAIAMFSAVYLPRRFGLLVPLGLMLVSDALIGFYELGVVVSVYASFGVSVLIGFWVRRHVNPQRLLAASLAGSIAFFLITNTAVWRFGHGYPPGVTGLLDAYIAGLPFFRNTVLGDLVYTASTFGLYSAVMVYLRKRLVQTDPALPNG